MTGPQAPTPQAPTAPTPTAAQLGATVWLTGLPSAGKTTIAAALGDRLRAEGHRVELLDGDEVRTNLCQELGFSREDRDTNIARIGYVAGKLSKHGVAVLVAAISPYREARDRVRSTVDTFIEVHVAAPVSPCAERDVKGLYAKARAGEIKEFTGVSDPYEPPENPELVIETEQQSPEESAQQILVYLEERELVPAAVAA